MTITTPAKSHLRSFLWCECKDFDPHL